MIYTINKHIGRLFSYNVEKYKKPPQTVSHIAQMFPPDDLSPKNNVHLVSVSNKQF